MFLVKITSTDVVHKVVEKAGLRGERALLEISKKNGMTRNTKQRKLSGWQTIEGAKRFIEEDRKTHYGPEWKSEYEILKA